MRLWCGKNDIRLDISESNEDGFVSDHRKVRLRVCEIFLRDDNCLNVEDLERNKWYKIFVNEDEETVYLVDYCATT